MEAKGLLPKGISVHYAMVRFDMRETPLGLPTEQDIRSFADWMQAGRMLRRTPAHKDVVCP